MFLLYSVTHSNKITLFLQCTDKYTFVSFHTKNFFNMLKLQTRTLSDEILIDRKHMT